MIGALGLGAQVTHDVLARAIRAPSVHNTQPWLFGLHDDRIEVFVDRDRALPFTDPRDKGLYLSCGAVVMNLRLELLALGIQPLVTLHPADRDAPCATVRHGGQATLDPWLQPLVAAIPRRRTNRRPFLATPVPPSASVALVRAAQEEHSWVHLVIDRNERADLRRLVADAHQQQQRIAGHVAEWRQWTGRPDSAADGVPSAVAGPIPEPQDEWVLRDFAGGRGVARAPGKDFEPEPLIVVLCSFYDGRLAELAAGQALQRMLLTATQWGLVASFLSQPLEVTHTAAQLRTLIGGALIPQTILRIGYGSPVPASPRRPIESLLVNDARVS